MVVSGQEGARLRHSLLVFFNPISTRQTTGIHVCRDYQDKPGQAMSEQTEDTQPVREQHRFDTDRLEQYMQAHVEGFQGPLEVEQFKGGQSNPTYLLHAGGGRYVLRRKPPGKLLPSAHAVDREYRVITALADTDVPVPRTYCLCEDEAVIGSTFYIMEYKQGRVLWDQTLPDMTQA